MEIPDGAGYFFTRQTTHVVSPDRMRLESVLWLAHGRKLNSRSSVRSLLCAACSCVLRQQSPKLLIGVIANGR